MESNSLIGRTIGVYEVLGKIGQGGMAEVYKGFHPALRRYVAIKLLGRSLQADPQGSQRFKREAQAIASLRHPNVIQVFDFGSYEGGHYLVMEYVEGTDLRVEMDRRRLAGQPFTPEEILRLMGQVADGLDYAHRRGVIHRDVKPSNILLTTDDQAILTDFGLAMLRGRISQITMGHTFGTPEYIAPEQALDSRAAIPQSDIYALGGLLYEMVTGHLPFDAESPISLALKHIGEDPTPPRHYVPRLPEAVEAVILRALAKDPDARFSTAQEMVEALRHAWSLGSTRPAATLTLPISPPGGPPPPPPPSPSPPAPPMPSSSPSPAVLPPPVSQPVPSRRRRWWLLLAGLLIPLLIWLTISLVRNRGSVPFVISSATATVTVTPAATFTDASSAPAASPLVSPSPTATLTATPTVTPTPTKSATAIPALTETPTAAPASTETPTTTPTETPTATPTATPTSTETPMPTPTPTLSPGETMTRSTDGMVMRFVPGDLFIMGAGDDDSEANSREKPQHQVTLSPFWMDETEVANDQYRRCVEAEVCTEPTNTDAYGDPARGGHPVVFVTWEQANIYCGWLAAETGWDVGLPTEAQWEKAASWNPDDDTKRRYPWGDEDPSETRLNYLGSRVGRTTAVGSYPEGASPCGILDMAGNVWEWVADWYSSDYYGTPNLPPDPPGPAQGTQRVMRGGSFGYGSRYVRATHREVGDPERAKGAGLGFRCVVNDERLP